MLLLRQSLTTPAENLALDEALLLDAQESGGPEVLRLWEWPKPVVVLGAACQLALDVDEAACLRDGVPILRRASGGGTVLLGTGCLLYSVVLAYETAAELREITSSYAWVLAKVRDALSSPGREVELAGTSDLATGGRKFSGNSQQRKRTHLLHHGTLLYAFDLGRVGTYLRQPGRQPEYRADRDHLSFLCNLPLSRGEIERRLVAAWGADQPLTAWPEARVAELVRTKYGTSAWVRRR